MTVPTTICASVTPKNQLSATASVAAAVLTSSARSKVVRHVGAVLEAGGRASRVYDVVERRLIHRAGISSWNRNQVGSRRNVIAMSHESFDPLATFDLTDRSPS